MSKILSGHVVSGVEPAEGDENNSSVYRKRRLSPNLIAILGLILFILASIVGLNYFNILPISRIIPSLSFLPTQSGLSSCKIVEEKYCSQAEHLEWTDSRGIWTIIGIDLPKGTVIYSPSKGQNSKVIYTQPAPFRGASANISNPQDTSQGTYVMVGAINLDNPTVTSDVEPGSRIGVIGDTIENTNFGYNFAVIVRKGSVAETRLKAIFPDAMSQSAKRIDNNPPTNSIPQQPTPLRGNPPQ